MMKSTYAILLAAAALVLSACSSITFEQYEQPDEYATKDRWHHAIINGMVEVSPPLNLNKECDNKAWTKVTTEHTFYNFTAALFIPNFKLMAPYSAWTNKVECFKPAEKSREI